jgi:hypothetical protein
MHEVEVKKIQNTDKFRPAAIHFEKYGYYCAAPKNTAEYFAYWDEETRRCLEGYEIDGDKITGYNYFYLNYFRINLNIKNKKTGKLDRFESFPKYWDYDKAYFDAVEAAEQDSKHMCVIKARGKGYSFKGGSMLCRNFYLIPKSKSYAVASETEFLTKDGLLTKAWEGMDFIDENTAWYKKRQKIDTKMHKRASIEITKDGVKREVGYKSEIIGVSLKNDPNKARGKRGKLILWEEGGQFPNLKTAWQVARPSVEDTDHKAFGLMIAYGTGSTEERAFDGLKDIFYEPDAYNCLHINNVWDDGAYGKPCGFFVPHYYNMGRFQDDQGNSDIKTAIKYELGEREKLYASATDRTAVDRYIIEQPFTPMEACLQISSNIFPKAELIKHLAYIRNNKKVQDYKQVGDLVTNKDGSIQWEQAARPKDLTSYRISKDDDVQGQIVIWEHPIDSPPYGLYIAGCDPYDHDQSTSGSLGSIFIYKRFQQFDQTYDIPVAEYTGRPKTAEMFYENVRKLLTYYNAKLLFENQNPGLLTYFRNKHCDYLLADQPDIIDKIIKKSNVNRAKGIHMNKEIKIFGEGLIKDWLIEERSDGRLNLHTIMSEALLEELISYNEDGNFDRVMAFLCLMLYKEELYNVRLSENKEENKQVTFFSEPIFMNYGN